MRRFVDFNMVETLCKDKGLSVSRMLRKANIPDALYYKWKKGDTIPALPSVDKIATTLGRGYKDLLLDAPSDNGWALRN